MAGLNDIKAYRSWKAARARCFNPKNNRYDNYGACGITMCERWANSFATFLADMGDAPPGHTLERKDSKGNYELGNCIWATYTEQARNRKANVFVSFRGQSKTLAEWADVLGLKYHTFYARYCKGWSMEKIASKPVGMQGKDKYGNMVRRAA